MKKYKVDISVDDLGIMYQDAGPWRSYALEAYGDTEEEVLDNAYIYEIDQDGGELNCYNVSSANSEVERVAMKLINEKLKNI